MTGHELTDCLQGYYAELPVGFKDQSGNFHVITHVKLVQVEGIGTDGENCMFDVVHLGTEKVIIV